MSNENSFVARPGRSCYSASKFAIEAIHESLVHEVKTHGVRVLVVQPGGYRTVFSRRIITPAQYESGSGFSEAYKGTAVEQMVNASRNLTSIPDFIKGDSDKAAQAIVKAVLDGHEYLRLPLGKDCAAALEYKIGDVQEDLDATRAIATATDGD